jgi:RHS repeat-associated protein
MPHACLAFIFLLLAAPAPAPVPCSGVLFPANVPACACHTGGPATRQVPTLQYDARNRLTNVVEAGVRLGYDPQGRRVTVTAGTNTTRWLMSPGAGQPLMRVKANGKRTFYVFGTGLLYEEDEDHGLRVYHHDLRGSTMAVTDAQAKLTDRADYDAYGQLTYRAGKTDTPFLFHGRYGVQSDPGGLVFMRARYYSPALCRFLTPDPIGFGGGLNWYEFAGGNPVSFVDPLGLGRIEAGDVTWTDRGLSLRETPNQQQGECLRFEDRFRRSFTLLTCPASMGRSVHLSFRTPQDTGHPHPVLSRSTSGVRR